MPETTTTEPATGEAGTETTTTTTEPASATGDEQLGPKGEKALNEFKERARTAEREAKAAKAELDKLRTASLSETEKSVKAARDEGLAEGRKLGASKIAAAEIRAAAAGRAVNVDALLEGVDASRFIDEDGEVDRAAITAWVDKVAPAGEQTEPVLDLGQGARGGATAGDPAQEFAKFIGGQLKR